MNIATRSLPTLALAIALVLGTGSALAFESGSTGADGALTPSVNTQIQLPPSGVLNYTTVNIPVGVTVTFARNVTNTPVVILVATDALISGTLEVDGKAAAASGAAGDGNIGDDGTPGISGPGGYDGGQGGRASTVAAEIVSQPGAGPGGGGRSTNTCGGSGGGFAAAGEQGGGHPNNCLANGRVVVGAAYGQATLLPLVGGSGGSGGAGGSTFRGAGGGGGAGALLVAASGTLSIVGTVRSNGGAGGSVGGAGLGAAGGGGSGGGIRLMATAMSGNGAITATGGTAHQSNLPSGIYHGGVGAVGRIRLEAETFTRSAASTPAHTFGLPGPIFVAGMPTLRIATVAGVDAPAAPTGNADISLPEGTTNPVTVEVATTGVPLGNTVSIVVTPSFGATSSHISSALSGTQASATANASVTLPTGPSTLLATVSYSVPAAMAKQSPYRELSGEDDPIERVSLEAAADGTTRRIATTRSGREIDLSTAIAAGG